MTRRTATLTPLHFDVLRALNTFRLLTYDTMLRLGVASSQRALAEATAYLKRHALIGRNEAVLVARLRTLPNVFWLTPKGAAVLHDHDPATDASGSDRTFGDMHEVLHRLGIVGLHIAAHQWATAAGVRLVRFVGDFDRGTNGLGKATKIEGPGLSFTPDALAWVQLPGEEDVRLLVIELERGGERGDLSRFFSGNRARGKLSYLRTLSEGRYIENAYAARGEPIGRPRFLVVFGSHVKRADGTRKALHRDALARWPDPAAKVWDWFFIKDQDEAAGGFGTGWHQPGDRPQRDLFKLLNFTN